MFKKPDPSDEVSNRFLYLTTQGIVPVFKNSGTVSLNPRCFGTLLETLSLLTMKRPSAVLLLESVMTSANLDKDPSGGSSTDEMLREFNLNSLSKARVGAILKRRSDLVDIL